MLDNHVVNIGSIVSVIRERLASEAMTFGLLRGLTLVGGMAALFIVPLRPEHQLHLAPLLAGFIVYNAAVLVVLARWTDEARMVFLATLAADLALVFLLVWFTGGGGSHFYLLFYLLVTINAYYFGPGIGVSAAVLASGLLATANWLAPEPDSWSQIGARAIVLGVIAVALGHVAVRERGDQVIFLRKIVPGGADRSYGIHVAQMAGLPPELIERAKEILKVLEKHEEVFDKVSRRSGRSRRRLLFEELQISLFEHPQSDESVEEHPVLQELRSLDIASMTPLQTMIKMDEWKQKLENK